MLSSLVAMYCVCFFFKQKTAYEMRISDWSSDVCSSDLFRLRARNPEREVTVGGNHMMFSSVGGPSYCTDLDRGRRPGTYAEMCDYLRLVQSVDRKSVV